MIASPRFLATLVALSLLLAAGAANGGGFAYDPEQEEGPHAGADFEWWYHFGFLGPAEAANPTHAFVSSFQRNPAGRYLFYTLTDLANGNKSHHARLDRALLPMPAKLPSGHSYLPKPAAPPEADRSVLQLRYGDHQLTLVGDEYRARFLNPAFELNLTLTRCGPAMPVNGNGLQGLENPRDQHYYSYPRMAATGHLVLDGESREMSGLFWYDHQWGIVRHPRLMKWCWWGLMLDNGDSLNLFRQWDFESGELVQQGLTRQSATKGVETSRKIEMTPGRRWAGPGDRVYHVEWRIAAPELGLTMAIEPIHDDHAIPVLLYGWIWEGPCRAKVRYADGSVTQGIGFQEMIGTDRNREGRQP